MLEHHKYDLTYQYHALLWKFYYFKLQVLQTCLADWFPLLVKIKYPITNEFGSNGARHNIAIAKNTPKIFNICDSIT